MIRLELREKALELKKKIDQNQEIVDIIESAGGLRTEIKQSDKLGFDWKIVYVNNIIVAKIYIEQKDPVGTADNPIIWESGLYLIQNAFYLHDGIRKVWTGDAGAVSDWTDEHFIEF